MLTNFEYTIIEQLLDDIIKDHVEQIKIYFTLSYNKKLILEKKKYI